MVLLWKLQNTHLAAMAALLNIVGLGIIGAFTASASSDMKKPGSRFIKVTSSQISWIASLPSTTAIFGSLLSGYLSLKLGRKATLMSISGPFVLSWLLIAYAPSMAWLYAGRLLGGFCSGVCSVAVPAYVIEISSIEIRGLLGSCYQISYTIGVLIAMIFGVIFRWSWLAIAGAVFSTCAAFTMYFMPESPPWLISNGKKDEALESIAFLKGKDTNTEQDYALTLDHLDKRVQKAFFREFQKPGIYKPIALSIGLVFFQQFSGINALMAYTVEIFEHAESTVDPSLAAGSLAGVQVVATIIGSSLMDKVGRTTLYTVSGIFVTLGLVILGIFGAVVKKYVLTSPLYGWIPLAGYIIFVASFSLGFGPIPYLMTPEFVPLQYRSSVLAVAGVFSSIFLFIVTKTFDDLRYFLSDYGIYWVYGSISLLSSAFCWLCLEDTKLKSIQEIQNSFVKNNEVVEPLIVNN